MAAVAEGRLSPFFEAGKLTQWGQFSNGKNGNAIFEGSEGDVLATILQWMPVISHKVFAVLVSDIELGPLF